MSKDAYASLEYIILKLTLRPSRPSLPGGPGGPGGPTSPWLPWSGNSTKCITYI